MTGLVKVSIIASMRPGSFGNHEQDSRPAPSGRFASCRAVSGFRIESGRTVDAVLSSG